MNSADEHTKRWERLAAITGLVILLGSGPLLFASCGGEDLVLPGSGVILPTATEVPPTETPVP